MKTIGPAAGKAASEQVPVETWRAVRRRAPAPAPKMFPPRSVSVVSGVRSWNTPLGWARCRGRARRPRGPLGQAAFPGLRGSVRDPGLGQWWSGSSAPCLTDFGLGILPHPFCTLTNCSGRR